MGEQANFASPASAAYAEYWATIEPFDLPVYSKRFEDNDRLFTKSTLCRKRFFPHDQLIQ